MNGPHDLGRLFIMIQDKHQNFDFFEQYYLLNVQYLLARTFIYRHNPDFRLREHDFSKTKPRRSSKWKLKTGGYVVCFKIIKKMLDQLKAAETAAC